VKLRSRSDEILTSLAWVESVVTQDPLLLHLSLRQNLTLGCHKCPSDQEIWDALELVDMSKAVGQLDGKLDVVVSGDGLEFSRGQVRVPSHSCFMNLALTSL
jgi:ABC-type multidrug transport system fused ATPase/permease subunit